MTAYRSLSVDPQVYRPTPGCSITDRTAEQDAAAGGRQARLITRDDGTLAAASVALRCFPQKRRVYAYLRWAEANVTREKYLGDVSAFPDRASALRAAWQRATTTRQDHPTDATAPASASRWV